MAKIISFEKMRQAIRKRREAEALLQSTEDDIAAILNDYSLTPAERTLNALVAGAEGEIARAYGEFEAKVRGMTVAVRKLTGYRPGRSCSAASNRATRRRVAFSPPPALPQVKVFSASRLC